MSLIETLVETLDEIFSEASISQDDLREAEDALIQMKYEIHSVTNKAIKDGYLDKMRQYNKIINTHRIIALTHSSTRNHAVSTKSLQTLRDAHAQLMETEVIAIRMLTDLNEHKEKITKIHEGVNQSQQQLNYSNKLINRMSRWWRG